MDKQLRMIIYIGLLAVLVFITLLVMSINRKSTLSSKNTEFAYKDTQNIEKIFMADMTGNTVLLERTPQGWMVNGKYEANQDRIDMLMETIATITVKNPVPLSMNDFVIRNLATSSVKVEIYTNKKKPVKVYYVGTHTTDYLGTYMLLESKNKTPFVVYKPGLNGYLSEGYYFTDEAEWRTKVIFNYEPEKIQRIEVNYHNEPDSSFVLNALINSFKIEPLIKERFVPYEPDQKKIRRFLSGFINLQYMEVANYKFKKNFKDSLLRQIPVIKVSVTEAGKNTKTLFLYTKPIEKSTKADTELSYDPGYYYAYLNDRPDQIFIMQQLVLERILWKANDFKN